MKKLYGLILGLTLILGLWAGAYRTAPVVSADPIRGRRVQLPSILATEGWETEIRIENVGIEPTQVEILFWGPHTGECPPNVLDPQMAQCSGNIPPGGVATFKLRDVFGPLGPPMSAIVYSTRVDRGSDACEEARNALGDTFDWLRWEQEWRDGTVPELTFGDAGGAQGSPVAVTVTRVHHGGDGTLPRNSTYTGITEFMEGEPDETGSFNYFVPLVFDTQTWKTTIWVQNSGDACTRVVLNGQRHESCRPESQEQTAFVAPGSSVPFDIELLDLALPPDESIGSAWIRAQEPLGIIVDHENVPATVLMTSRGMPDNQASVVNHAPLVYRGFDGWETGIQVQNIHRSLDAKVKVYFFDQSGNIITTITDWICPTDSETFYLPAIYNLPWQFAGIARIESQNYLPPGGPSINAPEVFSVVNMVKYPLDPTMRTPLQGITYNMFPGPPAVNQETEGVHAIALPMLFKRSTEFPPPDQVLLRGTSQILIQNIEDSRVGDITVRLDLYDANGLIDSVCQTIPPHAVDWVNLDNYRILPHTWEGAAIITYQCPGDAGSITAFVTDGTFATTLDTSEPAPLPSGDWGIAYDGTPILAPDTPDSPVNCIACEGR